MIRLTILLSVLLLLAISVNAQDNINVNIDITGKVIDKNKKAISGATVKLENAKLSTTTDNEGKFSLTYMAPVGIFNKSMVLPSGFMASLHDNIVSIYSPSQADVVITAYSLQGKVLSKFKKNVNKGLQHITTQDISAGIKLFKVESGNSIILLKNFSMGYSKIQSTLSASSSSVLHKQAFTASAFTDKLIVTKDGFKLSSTSIDNPVKKDLTIELTSEGSGEWADKDPLELAKSFIAKDTEDSRKYVAQGLGKATIGLVGTGKTRTIDASIVVPPGVTYDGKGETLNGSKNLGDGSQDEGQKPYFLLCPGASLKNVTIGKPGCEGIHVMGNNRISNLSFPDVGEDAISMRSYFKGGTVIIEKSSFAKGADKILQANAPSTWYVKDITVNGAGKVMRQNGGSKFKLTIFLDNVKASGVKEAIVRSDAGSNCVVYYKDTPAKWKGSFTKKKWDGKNPAPPTLPNK